MPNYLYDGHWEGEYKAYYSGDWKPMYMDIHQNHIICPKSPCDWFDSDIYSNYFHYSEHNEAAEWICGIEGTFMGEKVEGTWVFADYKGTGKSIWYAERKY